MSEWKPTQEEIDRGAEALRQFEQGGRLLRPWGDLRNSDRKKWREKAAAVIRAAIIDQQSSAREKLAGWMMQHSFATGHGDTMDDLLGELSQQVGELRDKVEE